MPGPGRQRGAGRSLLQPTWPGVVSVSTGALVTVVMVVPRTKAKGIGMGMVMVMAEVVTVAESQ